MTMRFRRAAAVSWLGTVACVALTSTGRAAEGQAEPASEAPPRVTAALGKGVRVETADGDFALRLGARAQLRASVLVPGDEAIDPSVDAQVRRLRFSIEGHAFDELISWKIQLAFTPLDQDPEAPSAVRDAQVFWSPLRDLELRIGQGKIPFGRQRIVSSGAQQFVDRSIVIGELNLDRDVGVVAFSDDLGGLDEWLGYAVGVFGGDGRNRVAAESGLLYSARLEVRPLGGTPELEEADFARSPRPRLALGVSAAFNDTSDRERSTIGRIYETGPWIDYAHAGVDWRFKWRGLSITSELLIREALEATRTAVVDGTRTTEVERSGAGVFVQAGQMLTEHLEIAARYGTMHRLGDSRSSFPTQRELGGAFSVYFARNALKLQSDYFHLFEPGADGDHQVRVQLQVIP